MLTDEQIDAVEIRPFDNANSDIQLNTLELLKYAKDYRPMVYKVLKANNMLNETINEDVMSDLIETIQLSLYGKAEYTDLVDYSIFDTNEIESLIEYLKTLLKEAKNNEGKVAYYAKQDYANMKTEIENQIKFLEGLISNAKEK